MYDGSATSKDGVLSLNDCLQVGPNLIPKLFNVLIRFRCHPIALVGDIEKAFLMISIKDLDRDMLRFLWLKEPFNEHSDIIQLRFTRLVFGLKPSPAILGAVLAHHIQEFQATYPKTVDTMGQSLYVDDLVAGGSDVVEVFELYQNAKAIMARGGFNLRKWNSNSRRVLKMIEEAESHQSHSLDCSVETPVNSQTENESSLKLLGVDWDNCRDELTFNFAELSESASRLPRTKWSLLKFTASLFDPLGFLSPFVITLKMLFQKLCTDKVNWDEPLPLEIQGKWDSILHGLTLFSSIRIPRCLIVRTMPRSTYLHGFCDTSERAYATVLYLSSVYENEVVDVKLVCSKTRVSPTKPQSIPRLELLGAVILSRLVHTVTPLLPPLSGVSLWTDSMTVLHWIRNRKNWKQYVQHRVSEIRKLTNPYSWSHCPGIQNPADLPSRGLSATELLQSNLWWNGPPFIAQVHVEPPSFNDAISEEAKAELAKSPTNLTQVLTNQGTVIEDGVHQLIDSTMYSCLERLLRVTAYVVRFVNRLRRGRINRTGSLLKAEEIAHAEILWIRGIQKLAFPQEIHYLRKPGSARPPLIRQFNLFVDTKGLLRCRGRLNLSNLPVSGKQPILLPTNHHFVSLLVLQARDDCKHSGVNDTLICLRERFWILKGRQVTRKIIRAGVTCRRIEEPPYQCSSAPDLPLERVSEDPPFSHTGVDFAGPLHIVYSSQGTDMEEKVYVCLLTCASTRAVHLELIMDLSVETFLLALRRFASRRGLPATIISDNAKTFKASSKEVSKIIRSDEVQKYFTRNHIRWRFIVERAPWWGGFWEHLIQTAKRCLRKTLGRTTVMFDELATLVTEIESVINSRPLTHVQDDLDGISYTLSPSHLIYGRRVTTNPNDSYFEVISTSETLARRSKAHRHLLTQFSRQWRREYLLKLRETHACKIRTQGGSQISVGDIVVVKDDRTKRLFWKLAKVEELLTGKDGKIRAAVVRVSTPKGTTQLLRRSVKHLFPIEVPSQYKENTIAEEQVNDPNNGQNNCNQSLDDHNHDGLSQGLRRSSRIAARAGTEHSN